MNKTTIIYLPGLGGNYDGLRTFAIKRWNRPNRQAIFVPMNWTHKDETFEQKKSRLLKAIEQAEGQVVLIGESAGAAMGLVVAHENPSVKFIAYCGKIGGAKSTGQFYYDRVPAFATMLPRADSIRESLTDTEKSRMRTVRAYKDLFLSLRDNTIPGVKQIVLPSVGHLTTIVLGITIFRYGLLRAVKELTNG
jgi:hypothetical protein